MVFGRLKVVGAPGIEPGSSRTDRLQSVALLYPVELHPPANSGGQTWSRTKRAPKSNGFTIRSRSLRDYLPRFKRALAKPCDNYIRRLSHASSGARIWRARNALTDVSSARRYPASYCGGMTQILKRRQEVPHRIEASIFGVSFTSALLNPC